ncbi:MAG: polysaccharide deacetylase [Ruminococcaceae bacterium]|nr:polysaccharide deacetylase [Oscillospiraceae bacterium]
MKRDFIGKTVFLVAFVAILVVSVYGFSGKMMQERHDAQNKTSETTSDKQTDNNGLKTTGKTTEITTEKTTEAEEKGEWKLPKATDKLVCFTFDDGPYAPVTNKILDSLEKYNGRATFFVVGDRADTYSDEIIRASKMGCEIGTHTYSHVNLNSLSVPEMQEEIKKSCDAISKYTGKNVKVLRPPEGAANDTVKANVGMPMVLWSVDSRDWDYRNADKDYKTVMDNVFDGSIVLMHDLYPATADAVARLIPELAKQGYKFVTFSELMKIRGVDVEPGEKYFSATPQTPAEE